jgi:hypothetical protein
METKPSSVNSAPHATSRNRGMPPPSLACYDRRRKRGDMAEESKSGVGWKALAIMFALGVLTVIVFVALNR